MQVRAPWRACALGALAVLPALPHAQQETTLPTVKASSARVVNPDEVETAKTTRIDAQALTDQQVMSIKEAIRYEPGVSVTNKASRFGLSGFNIRGVEDNRILMQVDGVRMPDSFVFGGYSSATRDMVDIELLDALEIQRGTGSVRGGSDALGGTVSYITPRPEDLLAGRALAGSVKFNRRSVDSGSVGVATVAAGNDRVRLLLRGVARRGHESETLGDVGGTGIRRTEANPQNVEGDAGLIKLVFTPAKGWRTELAAQQSRRDVETQVLSGVVGGLARDMNTQDRYDHSLWSLTQRVENTALGTIEAKLYQQRSRTWQYTRQDRNTSNSPFSTALWQRYFDFQQDVSGLKLDATSRLGSTHLLAWGAEASVTDTLQMRDGYTTLKNGTVTREVTVDQFPTRDTPPAATHRRAVYLQDEWFASEALTLTLAGRYERYRLQPKPDAIYLANEAAAPAVGADFSNLAPKLGALWQLGGGYALAGQYAHGFRAPPYDDVNIGFANLQAGYTAVANPNLKPETSRQFELALRHADRDGRWSVTVFDNRYRQFIEGVQLDCPTDPACSPLVPLTFQSQNLPKVRIHGLELRGQRWLAPGWGVVGGLAYAKGRNSETGQPIYSVNPASGNLGVVHERGPLRLELNTTFAQRKKDADAAGSSRQFLPAGYGVVDLRLTWKYAPKSQIALGAFNVFNRRYYHWADVPVADIHIPDSQAGPERYSQPGRSFAITLVHSI